MKVTLGILAVLLVAVGGFATYMGAFVEIVIREEQHEPIQFVYRPFQSPSPDVVGQVTTELSELLHVLGVDERVPLQVYFPDGSAQIGWEIRGITMTLTLEDGTQVREIAGGQMMVTEFPFKNPASFLLAHGKIDPALTAHRAQHGYVQTEAWNKLENGFIQYVQPIRRN